MGDLQKRCMASWRRIMPDYQIKEWNESNSPMDSSYAAKAYSEEMWAFIADYVRLYALHEEGGIYLDTDVTVVKPFDPLLNDRCFLGFQYKEEGPGWIANAVIGAESGHHFLKRCMKLTLSLFEEDQRFHISPRVTTMALNELGPVEYGTQKVGDVRLYPVEYFYPYGPREKFSPECIRENTYCMHHWSGSWLKKLRSRSG